MSLGAAVPVAGQFVTGAKLATKVGSKLIKASKGGSKALASNGKKGVSKSKTSLKNAGKKLSTTLDKGKVSNLLRIAYAVADSCYFEVSSRMKVVYFGFP